MTWLASMGVAALTSLSALALRHSLRVWLLWACGVLALAALPISLFDPAVLMLLVDPELLALLVLSAAALLRVRLGRPSEDR